MGGMEDSRLAGECDAFWHHAKDAPLLQTLTHSWHAPCVHSKSMSFLMSHLESTRIIMSSKLVSTSQGRNLPNFTVGQQVPAKLPHPVLFEPLGWDHLRKFVVIRHFQTTSKNSAHWKAWAVQTTACNRQIDSLTWCPHQIPLPSNGPFQFAILTWRGFKNLAANKQLQRPHPKVPLQTKVDKSLLLCSRQF